MSDLRLAPDESVYTVHSDATVRWQVEDGSHLLNGVAAEVSDREDGVPKDASASEVSSKGTNEMRTP